MATVVSSPTEPKVGAAVSFLASGFAAHGTIVFSVEQEGWSSEVVAGADGSADTSDLADKATAVLTATGLPTAAQTVTIGSVTYTWRASVTTTANDVLIGADGNACLANLKAAVNNDTSQSSKYGTSTVANPDVTAGAINSGAGTLELYAKVGGTAGNSLTSTETSTNMSFGGATFSGGTAATGIDSVIWNPTKPGTYTVKATDGTTTATATCRVWQD